MAPPLGELSAKLTERVVLQFSAFVISERLFQQVSHFCRCLFLYLVRGMGVGGKGESSAAVSQHAGYGLDIDSVLQGEGCEGVPLRYNYDKPEKPRISRVFGYQARFFILFQPEKSSREPYLQRIF